MKFKTKVSTKIDFGKVEKDISNNVEKALAEIGRRAVKLIREELSSASHSGKLYKRDGRVHRASAPDEPPASYSGQLAQSLYYQVNARAGEVLVGSRKPYGNYLELGTLNMAPRPFVAPVMETLQPEIDAIMAEAFAKGGNKKPPKKGK